MELLKKLEEFGDAHSMFPSGGLILAAVSGGADSICLLSALLALSCKKGFTVAAAHFNHLLRGSESDRDEMFVRGFCHDSGVPLFVSSGDVRQFAGAHNAGIEAAARAMRYGFLRETAEKTGAARIATAHTADDNAETVLLNLTRGAGPKGLTGIPPVRGNIVRPMLTAMRREVLDFLSARGLTFVEDSSNSLDIYNRNIIRHHVVPVLADINPGFVQNVASSSALLREDEDYLSGLARRFIEDQRAGRSDARSLDAHALGALPRPLSSRVIRQMTGGNLTHSHVASVLALCASDSPSARLSLGHTDVRREYGRLVFSYGAASAGEPETFTPVFLEAGETAFLPELGLAVTCGKSVCESVRYADCFEKIHKSFNTFLFKYDNVCGKIVIRPRETGDKITLFGGNGTKTLKKLFIEKRIPAHRRARVPVIADEAGVLAVFGIGFDKRAAFEPGDNTLEIEFKETANKHEK